MATSTVTTSWSTPTSRWQQSPGSPPGDHAIWIHGKDRAGNWGDLTGSPAASATLTVINGAPRVTELFYNGATQEAAVSGAGNGVGVTIVAYEYTIAPTAPAPGSGAVQVAIPVAEQVASFNTVLTGINVTGANNLWVRVKDSTNKWSPAANGLAAVTNLTQSNGRRRAQFSVLLPPTTTVDGVEWSVGAAPANAGSGNNITFTILNSGQYRIQRNNNQAPFGGAGQLLWVRVRDSQGHWGPATSVVL